MIFVTGDTHGEIDIKKLNSRKFPEQKNLTKSDFVIIAGEFGLVWDDSKECKYWLKWLSEKNFTTFFIDGNHENFNLLNSYAAENWNGGKVHKINESIIHLMRGQVFSIDNLKFFTFGGAKSSDKKYRTENVSWWKEEMPSKEEYGEGIANLNTNGWVVDYIFSHTCPVEIQKILIEKFNKNLEITELNEYLSEIDSKTDYKRWYFGHNHLDENLTSKHTIFYNKIIRIN
jgi:DNA repair exonuclease SbcCD nuclease subunit